MMEFRPDANVEPWGPFIPDRYKNEIISVTDVIIASVAWGITLINVFIAIWLLYRQTGSSRSPLRSVYVWMIWLELFSSFMMGLETFLYLTKVIRPSFPFFLSLVLLWCIQTQLLLQIIINRIRIIIPDRRRSRTLMIGTAVAVGVINVSVVVLWTPARLQISDKFILINTVWDRIEKVLYLLMDASLNWYFVKVVKNNLINNGLHKYRKLLRFNQRMIVLSILMDIMIIAAMSIPNSTVYIQFHPLAYMVKLNIEMLMANLIKRIAISTSRKTGNSQMANEFGSSNLSTSGQKSSGNTHTRRTSVFELSSGIFGKKSGTEREGTGRKISFAPKGNQIKVTEDIYVRSDPKPEYERDPTYTREDLEASSMGRSVGVAVGPMKTGGENVFVKSKSLDDITEGGSVKSEYGQGKGDSDDEAALVIQGKKKGSWERLRG